MNRRGYAEHKKKQNSGAQPGRTTVFCTMISILLNKPFHSSLSVQMWEFTNNNFTSLVYVFLHLQPVLLLRQEFSTAVIMFTMDTTLHIKHLLQKSLLITWWLLFVCSVSINCMLNSCLVSNISTFKVHSRMNVIALNFKCKGC